MIREQKVRITPGKNMLEVEEVTASFDPDTITVEIKSEQQNRVNLVQVSVNLPDRTISNMVISREKTAANNIITNAADLRAESRKQILAICESAYYRQYDDMVGELIIIVQSEIEAEIELSIKYFFNDTRIRWKPGLQVDLDENNKATIIGYINVDNNSDFLFENVELKFAEFELESIPSDEFAGVENEEEAEYTQKAMPTKQRILKQVKRLKNVLF
ncbi:MAG: hypothetical protein ACTSO9_03890 [Candidatus Helarchaeota archaeon]